MGWVLIMNKIDEIYSMLDWNKPLYIQEMGRKLALYSNNISDFLQPLTPMYNKNIWENCAKVLSEKTDDVLEPYLKELLEWLQDINWPGALIIFERLKVFSGNKLKKPFLDSLTIATNIKNEEGVMWVYYLSKLLENDELKSELLK